MATGDLNIDLVKWELNKSTSKYLDKLISNNFLPVLVLPNRTTSRSSTLTDQFTTMKVNVRKNMLLVMFIYPIIYYSSVKHHAKGKNS